jgi:plastocyanin
MTIDSVLSSRRRLAVAAVAIALVALVLVAMRGEPATAGVATASAGTAKVRIESFTFKPGTLTVDRGTEVAFANQSQVTHTATRSGSFDTRGIKPGKTKKIAFNQRGSFPYFCKIHPSMRGKIVVE